MTKINFLGVIIWGATLAAMTNSNGMRIFAFINVPAALWVLMGIAGALLLTSKPQQSRIEKLKTAAQAAWMSGLISFVISLITVLSFLEDPKSIGPNLAVALLSLLYGTIISLVCHSLALRHEKAAE